MTGMTAQPPRIGGVIVVYHPDAARVAALAAVLVPQLAAVVVVDNTPGGSAIAAQLPPAVQVVEEGANLGIGAALNHGIERLRGQGCDHFFLSDQDSSPAADIVVRLYEALQTLQGQGRSVAAVGASFVDPRNGHEQGFPVVTARGVRMTQAADASGYVPASFLITSGSLLPRAAVDKAGLMDAGLFIDTVDMEWCYRAQARGLACYGVPAARMAHTIGDHTVDFWFLGRRCNPVHSPFRVYFQFRNFLALLARACIPLHCKVWLVQNRLVLAYMYLFIVPGPRWPYVRSIFRGLWDGLRGRKGGLGT